LILYAIPTPLGGAPGDALPLSALDRVRALESFVVENEKSARAFLSAVKMPRPLRELSLRTLDEHTAPDEVSALLEPLREGRSLGLLSEAGCPAIADPGAALIEAAHREGFQVVPVIGPSSLILALMASGLEGQRFAFCGYLPREKDDRERKIRELEKRSRAGKETQLFIETPYRNDALLESLLSACSSSTALCVAIDLTLSSETIRTKSIHEWKKTRPRIGKRPAVFLIYAGS
jgi:16S rRNA (cytidine1402-2'-O)-methyltransferase